MNKQLNPSVSTDSGIITCCVQLHEKITSREIREEIECQANISHGIVELYCKPFYINDDMLFKELYQCHIDLSKLTVCYGDYWTIFIKVRNSTLFTIPLNPYSCINNLESVISEVLKFKEKDFVISHGIKIEYKSTEGKDKEIIISLDGNYSQSECLCSILYYLLSITHSSFLAYDCLCNINYLDISTLPFLTKIIALNNRFFQDPNQYFPFNFFHILLLILRSLHYRLKTCYDSLLDVPLTLLHQYLPFIKELIHSYSILFQRYVNESIQLSESILLLIIELLNEFVIIVKTYLNTQYEDILQHFIPPCIYFLKEYCCSSFFGLSSEDCEICTICIRLYSLSSSLCHQDIIHALCGCCRDGHSLSFSSLIETARCLIYEQLGIQAFLHELQSYSLSSSVLSSVLVILTSFLCDSTLAIDLIPSFTISPSILSTVQQDHSFIEVWSNYILSKQTRFHQTITYQEIQIVEYYFIHYSLPQEMIYSRRLLSCYLQSFHSIKEVDYLLIPSLSLYTDKLYSSLSLLYQSKSSNELISVISSLSILISNDFFKIRMKDRHIIDRLDELLCIFLYEKKRTIVFELMNLLSLIIHEESSLASSILTKQFWNRLNILSSFATQQIQYVEQSIFLSYVTTMIQAAIVCLYNELYKCWSIHSKQIIQSLLKECSTGCSDIQLSSIKQYLSLFSLFDTIIILDEEIVKQWTELLIILLNEQALSLSISFIHILTHVLTDYSILAIMRDIHCMDAFIQLLSQYSPQEVQLLLCSFYHFIAIHHDDPNISSLLSPSHVLTLIQSSILTPSLTSFSLFLFINCFSRCMVILIQNHSIGSLESVVSISKSITSTLTTILYVFSTSSWQDRGIQNDVFTILKQFNIMGISLPISFYLDKMCQLLHSFYQSYVTQFSNAYPVTLFSRPIYSVPIQSSQVSPQTAIRRRVASSKKSYHRKTMVSTLNSIKPSKPDIAQLLEKRSPLPIWLESQETNQSDECVCIWNEDSFASSQKGLSSNEHMVVPYYICRCASCAMNQMNDEIEDLVHLLDFLVSVVLQPGINQFLPSSYIETIISYEEIVNLKKMVLSVMNHESRTIFTTLLQHINRITQLLDKKPRNHLKLAPGIKRIQNKTHNLSFSTWNEPSTMHESSQSLESIVTTVLQKLQKKSLDHPWNSNVPVHVDKIYE